MLENRIRGYLTSAHDRTLEINRMIMQERKRRLTQNAADVPEVKQSDTATRLKKFEENGIHGRFGTGLF